MAALDRLRQGCDLLLIAAAGALLGACAQSPPTPIAPIGNVPAAWVVIGDSGCRMKRADDAWQSCNDPNGWPFLRIAAAAARLKPDLVLHVGDYHYRENACPARRPGCEGSPWGYGWDTWNADFFGPA